MTNGLSSSLGKAISDVLGPLVPTGTITAEVLDKIDEEMYYMEFVEYLDDRDLVSPVKAIVSEVLCPLVPAGTISLEGLEKIDDALKTIEQERHHLDYLKYLGYRDRIRRQREDRAKILAKIRYWVDNPGPEVPADELVHDIFRIWPWVESHLDDSPIF